MHVRANKVQACVQADKNENPAFFKGQGFILSKIDAHRLKEGQVSGTTGKFFQNR